MMTWKAVQLGDHIHVKHGHAFKGDFFAEDGEYVLLTPGNIYPSGGLKLDGGLKYYLGDIPNAFVLSKGDIVVVMTDLKHDAPLLGGSFRIPTDNRFLHNQRLGLVQQKEGCEIDSAFLYHVFNTHAFRGQIRGSATGATVRHTAPERIYRCTISIPTERQRQQDIARILDAYDDLIENNRRRIALLEEAAHQLYKEWFVRLRFPGHENTKIVDGLPEGWTRATFGDCATMLSGGTPSKKLARYWDGDIPWVTAKDLKVHRILDSQDHVTQEGADNGTRLVPAGTILFVVRGMSLAKEFRVAMATRDVAFNQDLKALRIHEGIDPIFLFNFLLTSKHHIMGICGEAAHGTKKLETDRVLGVPLLLPPEDLQSKYVSLAGPAQEMMIRLEQQSAKLAEARDLLLPRLMSGEIEV